MSSVAIYTARPWTSERDVRSGVSSELWEIPRHQAVFVYL